MKIAGLLVGFWMVLLVLVACESTVVTPPPGSGAPNQVIISDGLNQVTVIEFNLPSGAPCAIAIKGDATSLTCDWSTR